MDVYVFPATDSGVPQLLSLNVTGAASTLTPTFNPDTYDYYVTCAAGTNHLSEAMTANPGSVASLTQPKASSKAEKQTVEADVASGEAIVAVATATKGGKTSLPYWVRCLPADFPALKMTVSADAKTASPAYYLLGNATIAGSPTESGYAMILDGNGTPVWYSAPVASRGTLGGPIESFAPGQISFVPVQLMNTTTPFTLETLSVTPPKLTSLAPTSPEKYPSDQHELRFYNEHYYVLSYDFLKADLTGVKLGTANVGGKNSTLQDCTVLEIDPTSDAVTWSWHASEHFDPVTASIHPSTSLPTDGVPPDGSTGYDMFHCTSVDIDPANGNLLISSRYMDSVFYVERTSSKVLWKMGGVDTSKVNDEATFVSVADPFDGQHDARLVGWDQKCNGGTGQVSLFDDETRGTHAARAVLYDVVVGGPPGDCSGAGKFDGGPPTAGTATTAWQLSAVSSVAGAGSFRMAADGTRIVGWGISSGNGVFTEADAQGKTLRNLSMGTDISYRAIKVPTSQFDLDMLRANAGK